MNGKLIYFSQLFALTEKLYAIIMPVILLITVQVLIQPILLLQA